MNRKMNIIFFDEKCPLCCKSVAWVLKIDKHAVFLFAPLQGKTAERLPKYLRNENTLILMDHKKKIWVRAQAIFQICWLVGGLWKCLGSLSFIPFFPTLLYRLVAHYRTRSSSQGFEMLRAAYPKRFMK